MMKNKLVPGCYILCFSICLLLCSTSAVDEHSQEPAENNNAYGNGTEGSGHGNETDGNEPHEEEGHHAGHYVVWPSAIGMMVFITGASFLFYYFYSKATMKKVSKEHAHQVSFFQDAVVSSTAAGFAAPGVIALDEKSQTKIELSQRDHHSEKPETKKDVLASKKNDVLQPIAEECDDVFK